MSAASDLTGRKLKGNRTGHEWIVLERLNPSAPGVNYSQRSYGYRVKRVPNGEEAFMKAVDADLLAESNESLVVRLHAVLAHHQFEMQISDHCRGNNMDRVSLAIDHGDSLVESQGVKEPIFFLIFEIADGDIRNQIMANSNWATPRKCTVLHHVAVGLSQLHSASVCHNDLKPPNILVYSDTHKVADLGQATRDDRVAPHDYEAIVGDPRYAPPETLYMADGQPGTKLLGNRVRQSGDLYLFGSLVFYMFSGRMMTPAVLDGMLEVHQPPYEQRGWQGTYADLLPYWRHSLSIELLELRQGLQEDGALDGHAIDEVVGAVSYLCEPDPELRGHPQDSVRGKRTYALQRFIALFQRLSYPKPH